MNSGWLLCLLSFTGPLPQWRTQLLAEAERYATWSWQMEVNNQSCAEVNDYQSDFSLGPQVGVAYQWGGFDTPDDFAEGLSQGRAAGAHLEHSSTALSCATGVDCSGLVSRLWGLPQKHSTRTLPDLAEVIPREDLLPGDVLNKPGTHVVIFAGLRDDGAPLYYEASGAVGKVHLETMGSWAKLDGYQPLRLRSTVAVAVAEPPEASVPPDESPGSLVDPSAERRGRRRTRRGPLPAPTSTTCHCLTAPGEPWRHLLWVGAFSALTLFRRPRK